MMNTNKGEAMNSVCYEIEAHKSDILRLKKVLLTLVSMISVLIFLSVKVFRWKLFFLFKNYNKNYRDRDYIRDAEIKSYLELKI